MNLKNFKLIFLSYLYFFLKKKNNNELLIFGKLNFNIKNFLLIIININK